MEEIMLNENVNEVDLHKLYAQLDCEVLQNAWSESAKAGNMDEAVFWRNALNVFMQCKQKKLIESGEYYG